MKRSMQDDDASSQRARSGQPESPVYYDEDDAADQPDAHAAAALQARAVDSPPEAKEDGAEDFEEDESASVAASDAAVVGRHCGWSRSEHSGEKPRKRSRTESAPVELEERAVDLANLTYPHPENFPQRLMCVLQSGVAYDSIWWVGDGEGVALHTKNLKEGNILERHFQISDYATFIQILTLWGFRRVSHYPVPEKVATYKCSLFQKDRPHLVKHMRTEDTQRGFGNPYGRLDPDPAPYGRLDPNLASRMVPESIEFAGTNRQSKQQTRQQGVGPGLQPHQQQLIDWLNGQTWAQTAPPNAFGTAPAPAPTMRAPLQEQQEGSLASSLASLLLQGGRPNQQTSTESNILYAQILQLSQQYLSQPASASNISVRTVLQLLQAFEVQNQPQQPLLQQLNSILRDSGRTPVATSAAQPPAAQIPQAPAPSSSHLSSGNVSTVSALEALLRSCPVPSSVSVGQNNNLPLNLSPSGTNSMAQLHNLLMQGGGISQQMQASPAPAGQPQLQPQQQNTNSSQPGIDVHALLRQMIQQQQGLGNNQDTSRP